MKNKTCCFSGHRDVDIEDIKLVKGRLYNEIEQLIKNGIIFYGSGGARGFDLLASEIVLKLKQKYPYVRLILVLPCLNQSLYWNEQGIEKYNRIKHNADKINVLSEKYYKGCMFLRNRHLVDNSSYIICYKRKNTGGTAYTVNYAEMKKLKIIFV